MHLPVLRLLRGAALLLPILGTPAARAGLICDEPDGSARFSSALALNAYLAEIGIDAARDRIALAEGRSGDNSLSGVWDVGLSIAGQNADAPAGGVAQYRWSKSDDSSWVSFALTRRADRLTFTVGKTVTSFLDPGISAITTLALITSSGGRDDAVRLHELSLDGTRLREIELNAEDGKSDIALLERLSGNFTLAGEVRMRWEDTIDAKNPGRMMFQLAGFGTPSGDVVMTDGSLSSGAAAAIPEPASALLLLTGMLGLAGGHHLRARPAWRSGKSPQAGSGGRI